MMNRMLLQKVGGVQDTDSLIIRVKTDNTGTTNDNQFNLGIFGTYDVDWGDGNVDSGVTGPQTHTYATIGEYDVKVSNTFNNYQFDDGGDGNKLINVKQFGTAQLNSLFIAFRNTQLSSFTATDAPNLTNVDNMGSTFRDTPFNQDISSWDVSNVNIFSFLFRFSNFNQDISSWDVSNVINMLSAFRDTPFNQDISSWDVSNVENMIQMFGNATDFDQNISNWNIVNVSRFDSFLEGAELSTQNYDALLVGWEQTLQAAYPNGVGYPHTIDISFGTSKYTAGSAAASARQRLIDDFGWTIADGGFI